MDKFKSRHHGGWTSQLVCHFVQESEDSDHNKETNAMSWQACSVEPGLTNKQLFLTNDDLKVVEPARRKWRHINFVTFWIADAFNVNTWMIAASSLTAGLAWWQAWLCVWTGYTIAACFVVLTGRIGATYHIGFPIVNRASFGIWGSLWPVLNRGAMAW